MTRSRLLRAFRPNRAIPPHLSAGIVSLALFLALGVIAHLRALAPLDEALMRAAVTSRPAGATDAMNAIFRLGYAPLDALLAGLWAGLTLLRTRSLRLAALPLLLAAVVAVQTSARLVVVRPGPGSTYAISRAYAPTGAVRGLDQSDAALRGAFVATTGAGNASDQGNGSYPSGHAARIAFLCLLGYNVVRGRLGSRARLGLALGLAAVAGAVGYSTLYFGYHWPSDVLGGYLLGAATFALGRRWLATTEDTRVARATA